VALAEKVWEILKDWGEIQSIAREETRIRFGRNDAINQKVNEPGSSLQARDRKGFAFQVF
jgi:hypothetical protein